MSFNWEEASVVEYLLVENPLKQKVRILKILPHEVDSKHTLVTATFRIKTIEYYQKTIQSTKSQGSYIFSSRISC